MDGDFLTALLARARIAAHPGADILYDVRASRAVPDTVRAAGGRRCQPGGPREHSRPACAGKAACSAARSRAAATSPTSTTRTRARCRRCSCSSCSGAQGRTLADCWSRTAGAILISGEINSVVADPAAKLDELGARYADAEITALDGISIDYDDWHFNVRASNTEPLLRLSLESLVSEADMAAPRDEVLELIRA